MMQSGSNNCEHIQVERGTWVPVKYARGEKVKPMAQSASPA